MPQMTVWDIPTRYIIFDPESNEHYLRADMNDTDLPMSAVKPDRIIWYQLTWDGLLAVGGISVSETAKRLEREYQAHMAAMLQ